MKIFKYLLVIILISVVSFWRMLRPGIYSMQDFHLFRLYEFDKCVQSLEIPCRWAPDAGLGYGEPLFNFYGQFPYLIGEVFHLAGLSLIDSIKVVFIISLIGSALSMYFLSKELWKNNLAGVFSSIIYLYAPYRAVDVWVRGALPEAFAFVLLPLVILFVEKRNLFYFSITLFLLIISHNLSFVMLSPFLILWILYRKWWKGLFGIGVSILLSAFYVLPVLLESKFINILSTTQGYFDFRAHFITLKQIFLDRTWGYGGSTWGNIDGLNLSVGLMQWVIPAIILLIIIFKNKVKENLAFILIVVSAILYLLMTHNKTAFIWEALPFMKYIQFPWRFLGLALFCFALSSGAIFNFVKGKIWVVVIFIAVIFYSLSINHYFSPDIWYPVNDDYFLTGSEWDRQRTASIGDFWPLFGHEIPSVPSDGKYINYFPGWESSAPIENGLILSEGSKFKNTPIRTIGNIISLVSLTILVWKRKYI